MNIILGYGRTGRALAQFFQRHQMPFLIFDEKHQSVIADFPQNFTAEIPINSNDIESLIVSPGISTKYSHTENITNEFVKFAIKNKVPMISDIEFFMKKFPKKKFFGITGTNGKSTTASLLNHILVESELNSALCGNIGVSPFENAINANICSVEISSAQIELTHGVEFDIAAITNLSPDHIDRYQSEELYYQTKLEIANISKVLIVNQSILDRFKIQHNNTITFSIEKQCEGKGYEGYYINDGAIFFKNKKLCITPKTSLIGMHNLENILCAFAICHQFGIDIQQISKAISTFQAISHRLEHIATKNGIQFFNDSKATNLDSTLNALRAFNSPIFLIAGGKLVENIAGIFNRDEFKNVKMIGIIGECSAIVAKELKNHNENHQDKKIKFVLCGDIKKAIDILYIEAQKTTNSTIILSPFCKSFDQFKNFEERGKYFNTCVEDI